MDLMCSTYTTARKSKKWPVIIFFQKLDIAKINILKIFLHTEKIYTRRQYLFELALVLMEKNLKKNSNYEVYQKTLKFFFGNTEIIHFLKKPIC